MSCTELLGSLSGEGEVAKYKKSSWKKTFFFLKSFTWFLLFERPLLKLNLSLLSFHWKKTSLENQNCFQRWRRTSRTKTRAGRPRAKTRTATWGCSAAPTLWGWSATPAFFLYCPPRKARDRKFIFFQSYFFSQIKKNGTFNSSGGGGVQQGRRAINIDPERY